MCPTKGSVAAASPAQTGVFKDAMGRTRKFQYPASTFIDPDVVIDEPQHVDVGEHCVIRKGVVLRPETGRICIDDHCTINHYTVIHGKGGVHIGAWCIIAPQCGIYAQNHTFESFEEPITLQPNIGRGVYLMGDNWLGSHAVICDDVTLGKGAVLGANSTATRSVPMGCVAAGTPARVIKKRHAGAWDFRKVERGVWSDEMPDENRDWIRARAECIAQRLQASDRVLEVGCGEGVVAAVLAEHCQSLVGCDYSDEAVAAARQAVSAVEFVYSNATYLRFDDQSFDVVVMSDVAEHLLPRQFEHALREASRVLTPEGRLIVATPLTGAHEQTSTYSHLYEYGRQELQDLLAQRFAEVVFADRTFGVFVAERPQSR